MPERVQTETINSERTWHGLRVSYDEFLRTAPQNGRSLEWVEGEVIELSPASTRHQEIVGFLAALFRHWVEARAGGRVFIAPFQMKIGAPGRGSGREPDILYLAPEHESRLRENRIDGPADLAVEVVSPESAKRDRVDKLREYEAGGVREYWLIDPETRELELRVVAADGRYRLEPPRSDGRVSSTVLAGLWLRPEWLWQERSPAILSVLREWGLLG